LIRESMEEVEVRHFGPRECGHDGGLLQTMQYVRDWARWASGAPGATREWRYAPAPAIASLDDRRNSFHPDFAGVPSSAPPPPCVAAAAPGGGGAGAAVHHAEAWSGDGQREEEPDTYAEDAKITSITVRNRHLK